MHRLADIESIVVSRENTYLAPIGNGAKPVFHM